MQRLALRWRRAGVRVGLVPTMGLPARRAFAPRPARAPLGRRGGRVVVSIYVTHAVCPTGGLSRYPRDLARDARLCRLEGVDVIFAPDDRQMYPRGMGRALALSWWSRTWRRANGRQVAADTLRGVTTAWWPSYSTSCSRTSRSSAPRNWQQATIVQRMARDLNFALRIIGHPPCGSRTGWPCSFAEQVSQRATCADRRWCCGSRSRRFGRNCAGLASPFWRAPQRKVEADDRTGAGAAWTMWSSLSPVRWLR